VVVSCSTSHSSGATERPSGRIGWSDPYQFFHVAPARIADHLGERGCHISTFGDCVIDPTRIMRPIQCPPADRWRMLLVLASGIDSQQCLNTFSIFAKRWSTDRMPNSAVNLPFSLRTVTFPTLPRRLFNCPTPAPRGRSVGVSDIRFAWMTRPTSALLKALRSPGRTQIRVRAFHAHDYGAASRFVILPERR